MRRDGARNAAPIKLNPYVEGENIEDFLLTFERVMTRRELPEDEWTTQLMAVLSGKARAAFNEADPHATYGEVKRIILSRFDVTPEASRISLRAAQNCTQKEPGEVAAWIRTLVRRWLIPPEMPEEDDAERIARIEDTVIERVAREQYLNSLNQQARSWVLNRNPGSLAEMAQCVREYQLNRRETGGGALKALDS